MDGTLTEPVLDFKEIRRQLQIPQGADILHYIDSLTCQSERNELHSKLEEFEARAAGQLTLQQGLRELLLFSSEKGVKRALVTRNSQDGIAAFLKKLGSLTSCNEIFTHMLGREFIPPKPDPAPILHICTEWGFDPAQVVTVGDSIDDMLAGKRAGTVTVLVENGKHNESARQWSDVHLQSLKDVSILFQSVFDITRQSD